MDYVEWLVAREQIKELKARYFRGVDTRDLDLLRRVFAEDVEVDLRGAATDPASGVNAVPGPTGDVLVGLEAVMAAFTPGITSMRSVHHGHLPEIEIIDETNAQAIWPMNDSLRFDAGPIRELNGCGHYHETYSRIDGAWKIKTLRLTRLRVDLLSARV